MTDTDVLRHALHTLAGIGEDDFELSKDFWLPKSYKKGEFYNEYRNVCKYLGFILDGVFRTYYVDDETGEEKEHLLLFSEPGCGIVQKLYCPGTL